MPLDDPKGKTNQSGLSETESGALSRSSEAGPWLARETSSPAKRNLTKRDLTKNLLRKLPAECTPINRSPLQGQTPAAAHAALQS